MNFFHTIETEGEMGDPVYLEVEYSVEWGQPAKINCLPEDAEPATHDHVEIIDVREVQIDPWGKEHKFLSSDDEHYVTADEAEEELIQAAREALSE